MEINKFNKDPYSKTSIIESKSGYVALAHMS